LTYPTKLNRLRVIAGLALLTVLAIAITGYHVGTEDQDVYLAAAKKWMDPALYPVNAEFFMEQMRASAFIPALSATARIAGMEWALVVWHLASVFLILLACRRIAELCFEPQAARWAAVALVAVMLTIPIAGTALYPVDQYLHPRAPASAGILLGLSAALRQRWGRATLWMAFAAAMHPLMAAFGISLMAFLCVPWQRAASAALLFPFGLFGQLPPAWKEAALSRTYYFPLRWKWYEWLGMAAPVVLIWWSGRLARARAWPTLERIAVRLVVFAVFQFLVAMAMTVPEESMQLAALQPMRWLHIFYFFFLIIVGGLLGEFALRERIWAWFVMFGILAGSMFYVQRDLFAHSDHVEWPGRSPRNEWAQAFLWVRANTPPGDVFALDPEYMELPGEDAYGFRAWAERSMLAEGQKDPGAATVFPALAPKWQEQVRAQRGIENFSVEQFGELRRRFGVEWAVLPANASALLTCPFRNSSVEVCRIE
jgi:hypothetical protein